MIVLMLEKTITQSVDQKSADEPIFRCRSCGWTTGSPKDACPNRDGIVEAVYLRNRLSVWPEVRAERPGIWRYALVLPAFPVSLSMHEGQTPLLQSRWIGPERRLSLSFKDEGRNPSGSFKDRAAALMVSEAAGRACKAAVLTSSGNAACSIAMYCALAGMQCVVFVSEGASPEKVLHARSFGARVIKLKLQSEAAVSEATSWAAQHDGWTNLSMVAQENPLTLEGYKTLAYEVAERDVPDAVVVPVGAGTLLLGIWKGFQEAHQWRLIDRIPRLIGVQPAGSSPIVRAYQEGAERVEPDKYVDTIATGVALGDPGLDGQEVLRAVRETEGAMIAVDDKAILEATGLLARCEAILAEPSGALSVAGVIRSSQEGLLSAGDRVVAVITGSGLKDTATMMRFASSLEQWDEVTKARIRALGDTL